ncbi:MAG: pyridoxamine 5'-phosphate oxidase family protein [Parvularculaceae bacterium]
MARAFYEIAFTDTVLKKQKELGSEGLYAKQLAPEADRRDALGAEEAAFIAARDGFYQATVSETGWPYVQFRGGMPGFVHILDDKTIAYADFRGNRQYLSVGNLAGDDRVALFFMDYPNKRRLKLLGHARILERDEDPDLIRKLHNAGYRATPERAVVITVAGFDWNCPQHIPQRYTLAELEPALEPFRDAIARLEEENRALKQQLAARGA